MFCKADAGRYNKMTAEIVECSEVVPDLLILLAVSAEADNHMYKVCLLCC